MSSLPRLNAVETKWLILNLVASRSHPRGIPKGVAQNISAFVGSNHLGTLEELQLLTAHALQRKWDVFHDTKLVSAARTGLTKVTVHQAEIFQYFPGLSDIFFTLDMSEREHEVRKLAEVAEAADCELEFWHTHQGYAMSVSWYVPKGMQKLKLISEEALERHPGWMNFFKEVLVARANLGSSHLRHGNKIYGYFPELNNESIELLLERKGLSFGVIFPPPDELPEVTLVSWPAGVPWSATAV